jgi:hypothetical protein
MMAYSHLSNPSPSLSASEELKIVKELIEGLNVNIEKLENQLTKQPTDYQVIGKLSNPDEIKSRYPKARIDIQELSSSNPNMKMGKNYTISIKDASAGVWKSDDFTFNADGTITPTKTGDCKIDYVIDNVTIKSRTINVVK